VRKWGNEEIEDVRIGGCEDVRIGGSEKVRM
jgi:hypothetical protein